MLSAALGDGSGAMPGLGLTVVQELEVEVDEATGPGPPAPPVSGDLPVAAPLFVVFVCERVRSGEKCIELNAGLSMVGVGVLDVAWVEI